MLGSVVALEGWCVTPCHVHDKITQCLVVLHCSTVRDSNPADKITQLCEITQLCAAHEIAQLCYGHRVRLEPCMTK